MKRKQFVITALAACALAVAGCSKEEKAKEATPATAQQAAAPAAAGLADYTFETNVAGWVAIGKEIKIEVSGEQKHGGNSSLKVSGTAGKGQWNYAASQRFNLEPGKKYRLSGWMYVDSVDNAKFPPLLKCATYAGGKFVANAFTKRFDLKKKGEWQELSVTFDAPQGDKVAGLVSVEKGIQEASSAIVYVDDIKVEPAQ